MKHILFPTDFSKNAKNAIYFGLKLYADEPCKFFFLNVFPIPYAGPDIAVTVKDVSSVTAEYSFKKLIKKINKDFPKNNFDIETEFKIGELVPTAISIVKRKKIDHIIMGTQGASGITEVLIGSFTASVIKHVNCHVFAIPEKCKFKIPKKIVLTIADEMNFSKHTLKPLIKIANKYKSEIQILHVLKNSKEETMINKKKIDSLLKDIKHSYHIVYDENVPIGIEAFVKKQNADLLGMVTYHLNLFDRIFHRSITKKVSLHTKVPLLAMHDKK